MTEYAVMEYEQGIYLQEKATVLGQIDLKADKERAIDRLKWSTTIIDRQIESLLSDVEKAKADEKAILAAYQLERARRLWLFGF